MAEQVGQVGQARQQQAHFKPSQVPMNRMRLEYPFRPVALLLYK